MCFPLAAMPFLHAWQVSIELYLNLALLLHRSEGPQALLPLLRELCRFVCAALSPFEDSMAAQAALSLIQPLTLLMHPRLQAQAPKYLDVMLLSAALR